MFDNRVIFFKNTYSTLWNALKRQRGITGFVSILGEDPRIEVYRRLHHIQRVFNLSVWLSEKYVSYNTEEALLISLFHDVNRLPFAHNLEKEIDFDQAEYLKPFFEYNHCHLPDETIESFTYMLKKRVNGTFSSRLAYAADAITGFIEDPILAITTLDLSYHLIPKKVLWILGLDFNNSYIMNYIQKLKQLFQNNPGQYTALFNEFVFELSKRFSDMHNSENQLFVELKEFHELKKILKQEFLVKHVFPINNINVSQGPRLANEVALPYMSLLKEEGVDPVMALLDMTDQQLLEAAYEKGVIKDKNSYYPKFQ